MIFSDRLLKKNRINNKNKKAGYPLDKLSE